MTLYFNTMDDIRVFGYWYTYAKLRQTLSIPATFWYLWVATKTAQHRHER